MNGMRRCLRLAAALVLLMVRGTPAAAAPHPAGPTLTEDPVLTAMVGEALGRRPELAQAQATVHANLARVPQGKALPDPVLFMGIQNDGFKSIQIGEMETSWWSIGATQTIPWQGKRGLRGDALTLEARQAEADLERARLSVRAEVERAYVDLLLVRDQLNLLTRMEALWTQAAGLSHTRYETGEGAQSDILRAQLELSRLKQQRWALTAEERRRVAVLNRALGRPLDDTIPTNLSLMDVADPTLPEPDRAMADADSLSPELRKARLIIEQSETLVALARKDYYPDISVTAGVMPRGGPFETMWQAGVSFSIPLWAGSKQSNAVAEYQQRGSAAQNSAVSIQRMLYQRVAERLALLGALLEANQLYRSGLLVQSEATVSSTMSQYQVGRVTFASVLEALRGYLGDLSGFYESVAATQRIDIAGREVSLDPVVGAVAGGMGGSPVPGGGGMQGGASSAGGSASPQAAKSGGSGPMSRM